MAGAARLERHENGEDGNRGEASILYNSLSDGGLTVMAVLAFGIGVASRADAQVGGEAASVSISGGTTITVERTSTYTVRASGQGCIPLSTTHLGA